jgi:hypothetical protein
VKKDASRIRQPESKTDSLQAMDALLVTGIALPRQLIVALKVVELSDANK